jgi:hypothetical protein
MVIDVMADPTGGLHVVGDNGHTSSKWIGFAPRTVYARAILLGTLGQGLSDVWISGFTQGGPPIFVQSSNRRIANCTGVQWTVFAGDGQESWGLGEVYFLG